MDFTLLLSYSARFESWIKFLEIGSGLLAKFKFSIVINYFRTKRDRDHLKAL